MAAKKPSSARAENAPPGGAGRSPGCAAGQRPAGNRSYRADASPRHRAANGRDSGGSVLPHLPDVEEPQRGGPKMNRSKSSWGRKVRRRGEGAGSGPRPTGRKRSVAVDRQRQGRGQETEGGGALCGLRTYSWFGKLERDAGHRLEPEDVGDFLGLVNLIPRQDQNMS